MVFKVVILSIKNDIEDFFEPLFSAFEDAYDMITHFLLQFMDAETLQIFFYALVVLVVIFILMAVINKNN
jgi:hypothetical protein